MWTEIIYITFYFSFFGLVYYIGRNEGVRSYKRKLRKEKQDIVDYGRHQSWKPKVYVLLKDLPNVKKGVRFQQSYQTDNIYFYGIPINARIPQDEQVGIICFEANDVENNPKWFKPENEISN